ncbi:hypothetical protein Gotur_000929 [Gossypium turneri]
MRFWDSKSTLPMESSQLEDSKSSSEDTDRSEQNNDDTGTGRSYECVFCKRGFTTAQALGGHMNIHRKDRAKSSRPSSVPIVSDKFVDVDDHDNYNPRISSYPYPPIQTYHSMDPDQLPVSYKALFPDSGWGFRPPHSYHELFVHNSQHMNPFGLSLGMGPSHVYENNKAYGSSQQDDELDLELRLGHHP